MNLFLLLMAVVMSAIILPLDAQAQTDYLCLKTCVQSQNSYMQCKAACSFEEEEKKETGDLLVKTPRPVTIEEIQRTRVIQQKDAYATNYVCVRECLNEGSQYRFCEEKCARKNSQ